MYPFTPAGPAAEYATAGRMEPDENGVVVFDYGVASDLGAVGRRYNPAFIATYALMLYRETLAGDASARAKLLKNVDWLATHHEEASHGGAKYWRWRYDFDYAHFGAKAPWYSALAQGRIVVAFAQAYSLTGQEKYRRAAERAFNAFLVPMREGGLTTFDGGVAWLEEIAAPTAPSTKILNGHISAIAALQQYAEWSGRTDAAALVWMAVEAVRRDLPKYDASFLSWYAQEPGEGRKLAPRRNYNAQHVQQLTWLHELTGEPLFLAEALRFARYEEPGATLRVAGSTDPRRHGPSGLEFRLGNQYWSHNQFPTWVEVDFGVSRRIRSVAALARMPKAAPRHYEILLSHDRTQWERVAERRDNTETRIVEPLAPPKNARYVRMVIHSDNGNRNVALTGFTAIADVPVALASWDLVDDRDPLVGAFSGRTWCIDRPTYVIMDVLAPQTLEIVMPDGGAAGVTASGSNDLAAFLPLPVVVQDRRVVVSNAQFRYVRLHFADVPGPRAVQMKWDESGE